MTTCVLLKFLVSYSTTNLLSQDPGSPEGYQTNRETRTENETVFIRWFTFHLKLFFRLSEGFYSHHENITNKTVPNCKIGCIHHAGRERERKKGKIKGWHPLKIFASSFLLSEFKKSLSICYVRSTKNELLGSVS